MHGEGHHGRLERGVRQLERLLARLARKVALRFAQGDSAAVAICGIECEITLDDLDLPDDGPTITTRPSPERAIAPVHMPHGWQLVYMVVPAAAAAGSSRAAQRASLSSG